MVRTRFAAIPAEHLHLDRARAAIVNWLFAQQHGGKFLLRIDDGQLGPDEKGVDAAILRSLKWLGLQWDEGPVVGGPHEYVQSLRTGRYQAAVAELVTHGFAYHDYSRPDELGVERQAACAARQPFRYSRRWMAESEAQRRAFEAEGRPRTVRLKMPAGGQISVHDLVCGQIDISLQYEQDAIVQRADGHCLALVASVVDDHDFGVTHVIRNGEMISTLGRQAFIAQGLGYRLPQFAHLPQLDAPRHPAKLGPWRGLMGNRSFSELYGHGLRVMTALGEEPGRDTFHPLLIAFYQRVGFLPEALINYLLLLGWSMDGRTEFLTVPQMIQKFSLERVVRSPARFDPDKLWAFQGHYMGLLTTEQKLERMLPYMTEAKLIAEPVSAADRAKLSAAIAASGDRLKVSGDVLLYTDFFFRADDVFEYDAADFKKRVQAEGAVARLQKVRAKLAEVATFDVASLEAAVHGFVEAEGLKMGDIVHALRVAVTGRAVGPGLYDCLAILGKTSVLARIDRALKMAA